MEQKHILTGVVLPVAAPRPPILLGPAVLGQVYHTVLVGVLSGPLHPVRPVSAPLTGVPLGGRGTRGGLGGVEGGLAYGRRQVETLWKTKQDRKSTRLNSSH